MEIIKNAIDGLCPILGTVNLRRRNTDTGDSSNAFKAILARTAASAAVAVILGCAAGLFSAYIMLQVMEVKLNVIDERLDQLEYRFNGHVDQEGRSLDNHRK